MLLVGVPMVALVVRSDPSNLGLEPDGETDDGTPEFAARRRAPEGPLCVDRWRDSFKSAPIWQLSLAYWVCGITTASIAVHFVRWAGSEGISPATAAWAFGVLSAINAAGVLTVGWISDRMQRKYLLGAVYLVRAVAFMALIFLPGHGALWGFAIIGGMSWLATVPLTSALTAEVYGVRHMGMLFGLVNMTHQIGGALAVLLFGVAFDRWGSYNVAFGVGAGLLAMAGILALTINERGYSSRFAPVPVPGGAAESGGAG
jgi:MFS family permease